MTEDNARQIYGRTCSLHRHREDVPEEDHHVWPLGMGGPDVAANKERVCANGHGMVHYYLALLFKAERTGGSIPWSTRRRFGFRTRRLAMLGYRRVKAQKMVN